MHLLFALSGLVLFLLRPEGKAGLLLGLAFTLFLPGDMLSFVPETLAPLAGSLILLCEFLGFLFWPVFLHFLLVFPEPSALVRRFPVVERLIYLPTLAAMLLAAPFFALRLREPDLAFAVMRESTWFPWIPAASGWGRPFSGWSCWWRATESGVASRRKLRVAVLGTVAGILPLLLILATGAFFDPRRLPADVFRALTLVALLTLPLIPVPSATPS